MSDTNDKDWSENCISIEKKKNISTTSKGRDGRDSMGRSRDAANVNKTSYDKCQ